jgi:hypothetical protein
VAPLGDRRGHAGGGGGAVGPAETTGESDGPSETTKRVKHVAKLLESAAVPYSEDLAAAWIAPFNDEADPSFTIEQWLTAGWRDPRLVAAALSIFGSLERAQWCMAQLDVDPGSLYAAHLVRQMLEAHEWLQSAS